MSAPRLEPGAARNWLEALRRPETAVGWELAEWERVVRLARRLRLLARLAEAIDSAGLMAQVPPPPRRHLIAQQRLSRWRTAAMRWTVDRLSQTFEFAPYPRVLLKGVAYLAQGLPIAGGRLPSDLDILVPRAALTDARQRLLAAGWTETPLDEHDRTYYLEWSHELPPMTHALCLLELDLHHNIVPPVAHAPVDADLLLARLMPAAWPGWHVLDRVDQVLHSAAHLFFDAELRDRLRDLVDLDGLLRQFGGDAAFWPRLTARAEQLGLGEPVALAVHFTRRWLGTPVPDPAVRAVADLGPGAMQRAWLLPMLGRVLRPTEPDDPPSRGQDLAALLVLARHHYRRLPTRILLPHLWHKWRGRHWRHQADAPTKVAR